MQVTAVLAELCFVPGKNSADMQVTAVLAELCFVPGKNSADAVHHYILKSSGTIADKLGPKSKYSNLLLITTWGAPTPPPPLSSIYHSLHTYTNYFYERRDGQLNHGVAALRLETGMQHMKMNCVVMMCITFRPR